MIMLIIISYYISLYFSWLSASAIVLGNQNDHHSIHIHCDAKNLVGATNFKPRSFSWVQKHSEAFIHRCSSKYVFLKIGVSF